MAFGYNNTTSPIKLDLQSSVAEPEPVKSNLFCGDRAGAVISYFDSAAPGLRSWNFYV